MLRASGQVAGQVVELTAVTEKAAGDAGVQDGARVLAFTDAAMGADDALLDRERQALGAVLSPEAFVDACALVAGFAPRAQVGRPGSSAGNGPSLRRAGRAVQTVGDGQTLISDDSLFPKPPGGKITPYERGSARCAMRARSRRTKRCTLQVAVR